MKTNDEALLKIKYNVLHEVAKLAFAGELEEKSDSFGPHMPQWRKTGLVCVSL